MMGFSAGSFCVSLSHVPGSERTSVAQLREDSVPWVFVISGHGEGQ